MPNCMTKRAFKLELLDRKLEDDVELELKGDFQNVSTCFSVNFVFESGVAFHFGVRFREGCHEVFQDCNDGAWKNTDCERWTDDCKNDLKICLKGEKFEVMVDDQRQFECFECMIPFEKITCIELWDDVTWVKEVNLRFKK